MRKLSNIAKHCCLILSDQEPCHLFRYSDWHLNGKTLRLHLSSLLNHSSIRIARPQLFGYLVEPDEIQYYTQKLFKHLRAGVKVHIHKEYSLDQASQAHADLEDRVSTGKLLIKF